MDNVYQKRLIIRPLLCPESSVLHSASAQWLVGPQTHPAYSHPLQLLFTLVICFLEMLMAHPPLTKVCFQRDSGCEAILLPVPRGPSLSPFTLLYFSLWHTMDHLCSIPVCTFSHNPKYVSSIRTRRTLKNSFLLPQCVERHLTNRGSP